ncbi:putative alpha/beta superfamily hydrolase [Sphingomonas sp. BE138]|uniref:alpha/beta hydrolase n=1 Tax=Sphingomonas sp. BE138 TaxID=2817845 RepID=UPI0028678DD3|nr:alpha/beta hydrolase-fold protein [Sphingomonas sp. BE138]MDR6790669.1 putative alpha/beta superfamily hydrolase [Sphingomonas sp. BE138]
MIWLRTILVGSILLSTAAVSQDRVVSPQPQVVTLGTTYRFTSRIMDDTREVNIWLPPAHERLGGSLPVVYLLDGGTEQDFVHVAGLANLASLSATYGPMIVVGVQSVERRAEFTPRPSDPRYLAAFPESGHAQRFRRFLKEELIPFVESHIGRSGRRAVMGESLAGLFVVDTLLNEPALFQDYVAVSPSLWWDDRRPLRRLDNASRNIPAGTRLYLAMADEGGTMQDGVDRLRTVAANRAGANLVIRYMDYGGEATHATVYHRAAEDALRWLYEAPPYDAGPTPWYMIDGASPPKTVRPDR